MEVIFKEYGVNMKSIFFEVYDGVFEGCICLLVYDMEYFEKLMSKFELVEGVKWVECWDEVEENKG